jgi:hypothetical protein
LACSLIRRGAGANGQGVNPLARQIAQRLVDQPLALEARNPGKGGALDFHGEVRFAGAVIAQMAAVAGRIVDHRQMRGGKGVHKFTFDFLGDRACHVFPFGLAATMCNGVKHDKFHGRVTDTGRLCSAPGCDAPGNSVRPACAHRGLTAPATIAGSASITFAHSTPATISSTA